MERKQSVVRSLIDRANALGSTTKNRQDEIKYVKNFLKLNSYPNTTLIKKPSNRTEQQFKGFAIISYYPGMTQKIPRCLSNHNVKTVSKPWNTIGKKFANHKGSVDTNTRQGAVYQSSYHDCDFSCIGETKRSFSISKKEHLADIRHLRFDESALTKHVFDTEHCMDWTNAKILDFKLDFTKRRFIESYSINQIPNTINEKMTNSLAFIRLLFFKPHDVILLFFTLRQSVCFSLPICYNFWVNV